LKASGALLDYGCGSRPYEETLRPNITQYIGADVAFAHGSKVDVLLEPSSPLPWMEGTFDTVLSTQTLEHVPDPFFYIREAARVLKPGGVLILTAPMSWRHHEEPYDYFRFTKYGLKELLERAGLEVESIDACGGLIAGVFQSILDALASRGQIFPNINRILNPLIRRLDIRFRDEGLVINWMAIAKKHDGLGNSNKTACICPACESSETVIRYPWNAFTILRCNNCMAEFCFPEPSAETLQSAYNDRSYFEGNLVGGYSNYDTQTEPVLDTFREIIPNLKKEAKGPKLLDFGCAMGSHLAIARDEGFDVTGVEVSDHARDIAHKRLGNGVALFRKLEDLPSNPFDIILMMDVIEHFSRPADLIKSLINHGILHQDTILVVTTPNIYTANAQSKGADFDFYYPPYHLSYFSAEAFYRMLRRLGFQDVSVFGLYPSLPDSYRTNEQLKGSAGLLVQASGLQSNR
jgi:2-polyprenyl-3-methyl-5-hydroxy-6-metoxy-1,4-benzoquinol methylase